MKCGQVEDRQAAVFELDHIHPPELLQRRLT
jgi:hypothetical protein